MITVITALLPIVCVWTADIAGITVRFTEAAPMSRHGAGCSRHVRPQPASDSDSASADEHASDNVQAAASQTQHLWSVVLRCCSNTAGWLGSRVVSVLDSGAEGPGFKWQQWRCRVTVLGNCSHPSCLYSTSSKIGSSPLKSCEGNCGPGGK